MELELEDLTAYHEAGHAVMSVVLGGQIVHVSIEPPDDDGINRYGESIVQWPAGAAQIIEEAKIRVSLAGPIAEMIYASELQVIASVPEFAADWYQATLGAARLTALHSEQTKLLSRAQNWILNFLEQDQHWAAVAAVADELLTHETLEHNQLVEIVGFWIQIDTI